MSLDWLAGGTVLLGVALPVALAAGDDKPAPTTRLDRIPAHAVRVEREVVRPAASVPRPASVEPVAYEARRLPIYETADEPVYETREVDATEERQVPVYGSVEVPVFETRRRPVDVEFKNPFNCRPVRWHLWDRCEQVEVGRMAEPAVVGWRTESVPVKRSERVLLGTLTKRVLVGYREECAPAPGPNGAAPPSYVPPRTEKVVESEDIPEEAVTVVETGDVADAKPLPGTARILSEEQFRRERTDAMTANGIVTDVLPPPATAPRPTSDGEVPMPQPNPAPEESPKRDASAPKEPEADKPATEAAPAPTDIPPPPPPPQPLETSRGTAK